MTAASTGIHLKLSRSSSSVGADVLLRAAGISLVVLDHATSVDQPPRVLAGLNILLLVAGAAFARFLPSRASAAQIRAALFAYGKGVGVPSLWMLAASAVIYALWRGPASGGWPPSGLQDVAFFPVWYPIELVAALALLAGLFSLPHVAHLQAERPWLVSLGLVLLSVAARLVQARLWRAGFPGAGAPHIMLWNLTAGMMLFAADRSRNRVAAVSASLAIVLLLGLLTWGPHLLRTWSTVAAAVLLVGAGRVTVPFALGRFLLILSQASLFIFLLHIPAIRLFNTLTGSRDTVASFVFALLLCMAGWVVWTAARRAVQRAPAQTDGDYARSTMSAHSSGRIGVTDSLN